MLKATLPVLAAFFFSIVCSQAAEPSGPDSDDDPVMVSLGGLGAEGIFAEYLAMREAGELYAVRKYEKEKALRITGGLKGAATVAQKQLVRLKESGKLAAPEVKTLTLLADVNGQLVRMAEQLIASIREPTKANLSAYEAARQKTWTAIQGLLGLEGTEF